MQTPGYLDKAKLLYNTLRYLKLRQIVSRVSRLIPKAAPSPAPPAPLRKVTGKWVPTADRDISLVGRDTFTFLNETHSLTEGGWDNAKLAKLWRYNLHYFDDLNAIDAPSRRDWHRHLIAKWIAENAIGKGTGWDPFPTSLRIVNWAKYQLNGQDLSAPALHSLAIQARWLNQRLEYHILGNHLLANAKALLFASLIFQGDEATGWRRTALAVLHHEIREQILSDGGHFERSTMYHSLVLEDILDLVNIATAYRDVTDLNSLVDECRYRVSPMLKWLAATCHPDGEISFFNDAAHSIASSPAALHSYADRLGIKVEQNTARLTHLDASGYIRVRQNRMTAILDVAPVGPDYQPGHAHADTLSFELSIDGARVFVNSGTSTYAANSERKEQRGTSAHNTVEVAGEDSSEVWSSFRVARRARVIQLDINEAQNISISASHDGYTRLPGRPTHARQWLFGGDFLEVTDAVTPAKASKARFHLHPSVQASSLSHPSSVALLLDNRAIATVAVTGGALELRPSVYYPQFGLSQQTTCLEVTFSETNPCLRLTVSEAREP